MSKIQFLNKITIGCTTFEKGAEIETKTLNAIVLDMLIRYGKIRLIVDKNSLERWCE